MGDNLTALKALLPYYAKQVKCIYIDPPYNTGNERWIYNDAVNSPEIRNWLGQVVGGELDDLSRHDKWLSMMYPRLTLLKEFLSDDGVIFISIGKDEIGNLRGVCDEIFEARNLLEVFIWQIEGNVENQEAITSTHEYVLAYARKDKLAEINTIIDPNVPDESKLLRDFAENSVVKNGPANPASVILLPVGFPCEVNELRLPRHSFADELVAAVQGDENYIKREMRSEFQAEYPVRLDDLVVENGILTQECRVYSGWSSARKFRRFLELGEAIIEEDGSTLRYFLSRTGVPTYRKEGRKAHFVPTLLRNMGTTEKASNELERMGITFPYPKPVTLIEYLVSLYVKPGDVVMDAFAGSGTTGHAVLKLNAQRNLNLKFVLVEIDEDIARRKTAVRLRKAIDGYETQRGAKTHRVNGLSGGFRFCRIGPPLFDAAGQIGPEVKFDDLAAHIFFAETGQPLDESVSSATSLLGIHHGVAIYLLFNGILGDVRPSSGNVLTPKVLSSLPAHDGPKIIYGEASVMTASRLTKSQITFKQIPYQIRTVV